jgi:transcriptional regulator GlxA family with amidase domain
MKIYILLFLFTLSCEKNAENKSVSFDPEKVITVGFVAVDGVYNTELTAPFDVFQHTKYRKVNRAMHPFVVAPTTDIVRSSEGLLIKPDFDFASAPRIDILVVPSAENSMGSDLKNEQLISFVRERGAKAQYVMSLCDGAFVLAKAGLLDGFESTTFPTDIAAFKKMFPSLRVHEDVSFVHDEKAITSAGGAKSFDPAMYLVELLYGENISKENGKGLLIDWDKSKIPHKIIGDF